MTRFGWLLALTIVLGGFSTAQADWNEFWERVHVDFHRNNCYPEPFVFADRAAVRAPFIGMIQNGWRRQNTLGDQHFNPETNELNAAGEIKLRDILHESPEQFRQVYVLRTAFTDTTAQRIQAVQRKATELNPQAGLPLVYQTTTPPPRSPADYHDEIQRKENTSIPTPRLAPVSDASGSGM